MNVGGGGTSDEPGGPGRWAQCWLEAELSADPPGVHLPIRGSEATTSLPGELFNSTLGEHVRGAAPELQLQPLTQTQFLW